jgi:hypothetical protein
MISPLFRIFILVRMLTILHLCLHETTRSHNRCLRMFRRQYSPTRNSWEQILDSHPHLHFHLLTQSLIELIRQGKTVEALEFAKVGTSFLPSRPVIQVEKSRPNVLMLCRLLIHPSLFFMNPLFVTHLNFGLIIDASRRSLRLAPNEMRNSSKN